MPPKRCRPQSVLTSQLPAVGRFSHPYGAGCLVENRYSTLFSLMTVPLLFFSSRSSVSGAGSWLIPGKSLQSLLQFLPFAFSPGFIGVP